jgi:hypothetical protein
MTKHHHHSSSSGNGNYWQERTARDSGPSEPATEIEQPSPHRQAFHHPKTSYGGGIAGHWIHMIGGLLPLALSELIPEPAKYRKATRLASIGTTVAYEVLYTVHELKRRKDQEAKLAECRSRE